MEIKTGISRNNIIHFLKNNYYLCNKTIGKYKGKKLINKVTCKNCLKKLKGDGE